MYLNHNGKVTFCNNSQWVQNILADDAKMLLDIPSPMNKGINDHLALSFVDICLGNTLRILLCFAKIGKIDHLKMAKIWLTKF